MAVIFSCSSLYTTSKSSFFNNPNQPTSSIRRFRPICSSSHNPNQVQFTHKKKDMFSGIKECVLSVALAIGLVTGVSAMGFPGNAVAVAVNPALSDLAVLISGPPIKDPEALLRYALPIDNKALLRRVLLPGEIEMVMMKKVLDLVEVVAAPLVTGGLRYVRTTKIN